MEDETRVARGVRLIDRLRHGLLIAPEGAILASLLIVYAGWRSVAIALLIALVCLWYAVRFAALLFARAHVERGHAAAAAAPLMVARALHPWSPDTLALEGIAALIAGDPGRAVSQLRRASTLLSGQSSVHAALSGALLELGRPVEAIEHATLALAHDPRCASAHLHLAEAERACGAHPERIEEQLRVGLAATPTPAAEATLRCALAAHLQAQGRAAEATLTLHGAEALLPRCPAYTHAALSFQLGQILAAQGQIERAQEYLRSVPAIDTSGRFARASWRVARL